MGDVEFRRDTLFALPPAELGVLAAQIEQACEAMRAQKRAVEPKVRLGRARHFGRDPVQVVEAIEDEGHDCGVALRKAPWQEWVSRVDCERSLAILRGLPNEASSPFGFARFY